MISVAMATYNGESYVEEQLDSIRLQTKQVDEIVIVDDCSTDQTTKVVKNYMEQHSEVNIILYENDNNLGYKKNFQKALSLCGGDIVFLCDQDDVWMKEKVEQLTAVLDAHPEIAVISSAFIQMDNHSSQTVSKKVYRKKMSEGELACVSLEDLIYHNISQGCSMAIRAPLKEQYLQSKENKIPHDWAINVLASMQKGCYFLNSPLFYYRIHDYNTIGLNDNLSLKTKYTLETRTKVAKQGLEVIEFVERVNQVFMNENDWLCKIRQFSLHHISYLTSKNVFGILLQNLQPHYRKLKTFRGRMLDLFFVIHNNVQKEE